MSITGSGLRLLLLATAVLLEQPLVENAGAAEPTGEGKDALHPKEVLPQVVADKLFLVVVAAAAAILPHFKASPHRRKGANRPVATRIDHQKVKLIDLLTDRREDVRRGQVVAEERRNAVVVLGEGLLSRTGHWSTFPLFVGGEGGGGDGGGDPGTWSAASAAPASGSRSCHHWRG
ncbi:hypothetical protein TYRP_019435 [Tyrophagus putrescentiae]|nr:hypothetical protein TYRP_019435 [Tyrophagus putrescentiae]